MHVKSLDTDTESINLFLPRRITNVLLPASVCRNIKSTLKDKNWTWRYIEKNRYWVGRYDVVR